MLGISLEDLIEVTLQKLVHWLGYLIFNDLLLLDFPHTNHLYRAIYVYNSWEQILCYDSLVIPLIVLFTK